jgi:hypothetical protein
LVNRRPRVLLISCPPACLLLDRDGALAGIHTGTTAADPNAAELLSTLFDEE